MAVFTKLPIGTSGRDKIQGEDVHTPGSQSDHFELQVDVYNFKDSIVLVAQVAGIDRSTISLSLKDDVLYIRGKVVSPFENEEEYLHTGECQWGFFSRPVILPQDVQLQNITAKVTKENVLMVTVPKIKEPDEHVIRVELE